MSTMRAIRLARTAHQRRSQSSYRRFNFCKFQLKMKPVLPEKVVEIDDLKTIVEADETESTFELAAASDVKIKTIRAHLKQIGKVKNLDKCVLQEINDRLL